LGQEAEQLRESPHGSEIGGGVVTPHVRAVALNGAETNRLNSELAAIAHRERNTAECAAG
jgi:hypothetical protein